MSAKVTDTQDVFLSDVHTEIKNKIPTNESYVSRFQFKLVKPCCDNEIIYDEDGDLVIERENYEIIEIGKMNV